MHCSLLLDWVPGDHLVEAPASLTSPPQWTVLKLWAQVSSFSSKLPWSGCSTTAAAAAETQGLAKSWGICARFLLGLLLQPLTILFTGTLSSLRWGGGCGVLCGVWGVGDACWLTLAWCYLWVVSVPVSMKPHGWAQISMDHHWFCFSLFKQ